MSINATHDIINEFNRKLKMLTLNVYRLDTKDPLMFRVKDRAILACNMYPKWVLEVVGAGLYKYKDKIYNMDSKFAMEYNFEQDVIIEVPEIQKIIVKMRELYNNITEKDRKEVTEIVQSLLDHYVEYLSIIYID